MYMNTYTLGIASSQFLWIIGTSLASATYQQLPPLLQIYTYSKKFKYYLNFSLVLQSVYFLAEISPIKFNINLYMLNQTKTFVFY